MVTVDSPGQQLSGIVGRVMIDEVRVPDRQQSTEPAMSRPGRHANRVDSPERTSARTSRARYPEAPIRAREVPGYLPEAQAASCRQRGV